MTACPVAAVQSTAGSLQSLCWASSAIGGILSAYFSGSLVQDYGPRAVFGVTAIFPLVVSASSLLINEQRVAAPAPKALLGKQDDDVEPAAAPGVLPRPRPGRKERKVVPHGCARLLPVPGACLLLVRSALVIGRACMWRRYGMGAACMHACLPALQALACS